MRCLCPINVSPLVRLLPPLQWRYSGARPWDGTYGMLGWGMLPATFTIEAGKAIREVLAHLEGRRQGTTYLARLVPGQRVPLHADAEDNGCQERVHVPLVTNPAATFTTDGETFHMGLGFAWVIDPTQEHAAHNGGDSDRIHLFFNALAG